MDLTSWQCSFGDEKCMDIARGLAAVFTGRLGPHHPLVKLVQRADWEAVARYTPDFSADAERFFAEASLVALFKKAPFLPVANDPEATALAKFIDTEIECTKTNSIFDMWEAGRFTFGPLVERLLFVAQRKISYVLGDCPSLSKLRFRFTSGASTELKKKDTSIRNQLMADLSCSEDMMYSGLAANVLRLEPVWMGLRSEPVPYQCSDIRDVVLSRVGSKIAYEKHLPSPLDGGRDYGGNVGYDAAYCTLTEIPVWVRIAPSVLEFVPKTVFESRVIIKEPPLNKYVQTAYGDEIRDRLKERVGIDIRRAAPLHSELARKASITGDLATLDLTSASDLNAYKLIQSLYPLDWYVALSNCRTSHVIVAGRDLELQKFSGMGNGFTFPLQTLTYWALVSACAEEVGCLSNEVYVFGDDIICPVECVHLVRQLFHAIGLKLNPSKSFWSGSFRESCGADWLFGKNVRPIYIKSHLSVEKLFILHNSYFRLGEYELAERVLSYIPTDYHIYGPDGYGDGHLLAHEDHCVPVERFRRVKEKGQRVSVATGYALWAFKTVAMCPRFDWNSSSYDHAAVLYMHANGTERRDGTSEPHQDFSQAYKRELEHYLADGMSLSKGQAIRAAKNAAMRALLPDEVVPSRQRRVDRSLSGRFDVNGSVVSSDDECNYIIGMPLPGTEDAQIRTICILR
ncbi:TPA_asm: RNA-directed RNA polymerase [ssRNA phage SRR5467090_5]|uniref:RNA-directed RNA polymerase n=1 Tax=ssRNA phage SRR5467090_5 TaxID=2786454 RepID=A0A8S5KZQ6_9VIRU|nr:RNA-directed RNA polymerase [ssRNA phage SRR5467090_5]DAD50873.1 TPA_asm: RNA-directed RNA polymerase [ssRNA phage SRR5467090_5]